VAHGAAACHHADVCALLFGAWWAWSAVATTIAGSSCIIELDPVVVCGDGYVDADVGEECDPAVPSP